MAKIIDLNELVGEDIVFKYGTPARNYAIPGDIEVVKVFELFEMFTSVNKLKSKKPEDLAVEVKQKFDDIQARLLALFQIRDPKLKVLPFGIKGTGIVLRNVLADLGVNVTETPQEPTPNRQQRRSATKKTTAPRKR